MSSPPPAPDPGEITRSVAPDAVTGSGPRDASRVEEETRLVAAQLEAATAWDAELRQGTKVGRYLILDKAGAGGMGVVYAAYDPTLNRRVALKLVRAEACFEDGDTDAPRARLLREGQALAALSHPNVVSIFELGTYEEQVFIAMEFVEGQTLRQWLEEQPRSWQEIVPIFLAAGAGLAAAHRCGIIHRDFKPENVLLGNGGRIYVMDFGIARVGHDRSAVANDSSFSRSSVHDFDASAQIATSQLTRFGDIIGTYSYIAPEIFEGAPADRRADQFSFCVALYRSLYGHPPFEAVTPDDPARWVVRPPARASTVPSWLRKIVLTGLERDPERRYRSMDALLEDLRLDRGRARRHVVVGSAFAAVLLAGTSALLQAHEAGPVLCRDGAARLQGVWDATVEDSLHRAFLATGHVNAESSWMHTRAGLDRFANGWATMRDQACAATRLRGEQSDEVLSLRMECLDRRLVQLEAAIDQLEAVEAALVPEAVKAAQGLPDLESCADVVALRTPIRPPEDPSMRAAVIALQEDEAQMSALLAAGRYAQGVALAEQTAVAAQQLAYRPLEAEVLATYARLQEASGAYKQAEHTLHLALLAAVAGSHTAAAVEISAVAASTMSRLNEVETARKCADQGHAHLERLGKNLVLEASLDLAVARVEYFSQNLDAAEAAFEHALASSERAFGPQSMRVGIVLSSYGGILQVRGKLREGITFGERAVEVLTASLGPDHPETRKSLHNLGVGYQNLGRLGDAARLFERLIEVTERTGGSEHPLLAAHLAALAEVYVERAESALARPLIERALAMHIATHGSEHPRALFFTSLRGEAYALEGEHEKAAEILLQVSQKWRETSALAAEAARTEYALGLALLELEHAPQAREHLDACLEMASQGGQTLMTATCHQGLGSWHLAQHDYAAAQEQFEHANRIRESELGSNTSWLSASLIGLGQAHLHQRHWASARAALERGLSLGEPERVSPQLLGTGRFALAQVLWQVGERDEARALARRAARELDAANIGVTMAAQIADWLVVH